MRALSFHRVARGSSLTVLALGAVGAVGVVGAACSHTSATPPPFITVTSRSTTFVTREHMMAAVEMQLSGEPLAQAMGRNLGGYSRDHLPPDIYFDPAPDASGYWVDLPGFSSGVESYEYSKQPMNNLAFESGAGISLASGPLLAPNGPSPGCAELVAWIQHVGPASHAQGIYTFDAGVPRQGEDGGAAANPLGWPGIWPSMTPFVQFDPTIAPANTVNETCSITSDDNPGSGVALMSDDYECDANLLHLVDRSSQVVSAISPGSTGWAGWKSSLWVLNYLQIMHDVNETAVNTVATQNLPLVGVPGNTVQGTDDASVPAEAVGTYLGSSDIEGFQAGTMISEYDNSAEMWLTSWMTTDGTTLGGFPTLAAALSYDDQAPLQWFPSQINVTETENPNCPYFPQPSGYSIATPNSYLIDLAGLLGTYSDFFALTDVNNPNVGGSDTCLVYFDGDPFPADDPAVFGDNSLHDRALAMIRVSLVQMMRAHVDPTSGIPTEEATFANGTLTPGTNLSTITGAYTLLALRTARRSLGDLLTLYTNTTPDTAVVTTLIDTPPIVSATGGTITGFLNSTIATLADLFYDHLTDDTGMAWSGWDLTTQTVSSQDDLLDSHTAAIRALYVAYLATGDTKYRDRAVAVWNRVESVFWDTNARLYRPIAGDTGDTVTYTPQRFGLVSAMLRDTYELVASKNGDFALGALVESRIARNNKLMLNGWDDRNGNGLVDWPTECIQKGMFEGAPIGLGGLQMAERTLSGETGSKQDTFDAGTPRQALPDREHDCVPEPSVVGLPSALADSITLQIKAAN